jgi:hypothetical protein
VCYASAWDIDNLDDLRIKMCIEINAEDFTTIHHELGHNFYQRAYKTQPRLFRDSADDGFHEAIGDTIALSVTPEYLVKLGFLQKPPDASKDIGLLLNKALEKVAFLPFGLMIDQWRWKVVSGEIPSEKYNQAWWDVRLKYQGVSPRRRVVRSISTQAQSMMLTPMFPTCGISWRTFSNSSSTVPWRRKPVAQPPAAKRRFTSIYESRAAGRQVKFRAPNGIEQA